MWKGTAGAGQVRVCEVSQRVPDFHDRWHTPPSLHCRRAYTAADIDFLVAYAVPEDVWYVVPVDVFKRVGQIRFYPGSKKSRYEIYREAWCLMACPKDGECKKEIAVERLCERDRACPRKSPP